MKIDENLQAFNQLTCCYGDSPCQPIGVGKIGVIKPEIVLGTRKCSGELYLVANFIGGDGGVWLRIAVWRTVVETIEGIVQALIIRYTYS